MALVVGYSLMCLSFITFNTFKTKKLFNALNIYLFIWALMVLLYNLKWILYYDLSNTTWTVIYLSTAAVFLGYTFGARQAKKHIKKHRQRSMPNMELLSKKRLADSILLTSCIAAIAIIPNILFLMERYGFNILSKTTQIYVDNVNGNAPISVPYLGAIIYVSDILAGIYLSRYGYKNIILIPIVLTMLSILPSGSRGWLILAIFMFVFPYFLLRKHNTNSHQKRGMNLLLIIILIILLGGLFILLTINRSRNLDPNIFQYMSPEMINVAKKMPWLYKLYQYFASPVGVLNEFLKAPDFFFGKNTFATVYNFLDKLGFDVNYSRYQTFYFIPIETNVGTWLLELIQDFGIVGMFLAVIAFSFAVGYFDHKSYICSDRRSVLWAAVFDTILVMSFFVWYLREGTMVVILLTVAVMNMSVRNSLPVFKGKQILTRQK